MENKKEKGNPRRVRGSIIETCLRSRRGGKNGNKGRERGKSAEAPILAPASFQPFSPRDISKREKRGRGHDPGLDQKLGVLQLWQGGVKESRRRSVLNYSPLLSLPSCYGRRLEWEGKKKKKRVKARPFLDAFMMRTPSYSPGLDEAEGERRGRREKLAIKCQVCSFFIPECGGGKKRRGGRKTRRWPDCVQVRLSA